VEPDALLATLRRALADRPDLWQSWSAVVHELAARRQLGEAHELARQATGRFPMLAGLWIDLASVCRAREDREGELEALDRALRISPGWSTAARQRAAVFDREENYAESRAVLERAVAHAPLDAYNHGGLADALWHLGEKDAALDRLLHALRLDPDYDWAWDTLCDWSQQLDRPGLPVELARELTQLRGGEARNWLALARLLDGPDQLNERLEALDRAIALEPRDHSPHDLKAQLLAEAGRWDEAEAACRHAVWGDRPPIYLRGRSAWIVARRGDLPEAIARMRVALAEDPDYYWGWFNMAEWTAEADTPAEYLEAAEALVRIAPNDPVAAGHRADARLKIGDRDGAKEEFRRGWTLAPDHVYTAMRLFDLEREDEEFHAAGEVLASMKAHFDGPFVAAREVQLAVARGDQRESAQALRRLCTLPPVDSEWPLSAADQALRSAGWGRQAEAVFASVLDDPAVNPQSAGLWAAHCVSRRGWRRCLSRIDELLARGEVGRRALCETLAALGRAKAGWRIAACLRRYRRVIREHTPAWGAVGFALTSVVRHRAAAKWLADWRARDEAQPWMLINLVLALRALGRDDEANRVSRRALELHPDYTTPYHLIWLALDELIDGEGGEFAGKLEGLDRSRFDATNRYLWWLAEVLLKRCSTEPDVRARARDTTVGSLGSLRRQAVIPPEDYGAVLRTYRRAVRRMAADYGPARRPFWALARRFQAPRLQR
jgi:tetratricopeptide (TPR) repeat protein